MIFNEVDFGNLLEVASGTPAAGASAAPKPDFRAYKQSLESAFRPHLSQIADAARDGKPLSHTLEVQLGLANRELMWERVDAANAALLESAQLAEASRRLVLRRAFVRLLREPADPMLQGAGGDAALNLSESTDPTSVSLRMALEALPESAPRLQRLLEEFDASAVQLREAGIVAAREDGRIAKTDQWVHGSPRGLSLIRRRGERNDVWLRLNQSFADSILSLASESKIRGLALDWRAALARAQHSQTFDSKDTLSLVAERVTPEDVENWDHLQAVMLSWKERRDVAMRALAERVIAAAEKKWGSRDEERAQVESAVLRAEQAATAWELLERDSASAIKQLLRDQASALALAIDAHLAHLHTASWEHWRSLIDFCRPPSTSE